MVETEVVVVEEVAVQRWQMQDDVQAEDTVHRELDRVETAGDLDTTRPVHPEDPPRQIGTPRS
jgi:stress response protein YsnF